VKQVLEKWRQAGKQAWEFSGFSDKSLSQISSWKNLSFPANFCQKKLRFVIVEDGNLLMVNFLSWKLKNRRNQTEKPITYSNKTKHSLNYGKKCVSHRKFNRDKRFSMSEALAMEKKWISLLHKMAGSKSTKGLLIAKVSWIIRDLMRDLRIIGSSYYWLDSFFHQTLTDWVSQLLI